MRSVLTSVPFLFARVDTVQDSRDERLLLSSMGTSNTFLPASKERVREATMFAKQYLIFQPQRARDPRFDSLSGNFNKDLFEKSYSFLNDYRKAEVEQLHKELKKEKSEDRKKEIQSVISKMVCVGRACGSPFVYPRWYAWDPKWYAWDPRWYAYCARWHAWYLNQYA